MKILLALVLSFVSTLSLAEDKILNHVWKQIYKGDRVNPTVYIDTNTWTRKSDVVTVYIKQEFGSPTTITGYLDPQNRVIPFKDGLKVKSSITKSNMFCEEGSTTFDWERLYNEADNEAFRYEVKPEDVSREVVMGGTVHTEIFEYACKNFK